MKGKHGRLPKAKPENQNSNPNPTTAATTHTTRPHKAIKIPSNDIASRELVKKINVEHEKSDRLTFAKLNTTSKPHKQDYKSKLITFANKSTTVNTSADRMSE